MRLHGLRGERSNVPRDSAALYEAGISYEVILFPQVWMFYSLTYRNVVTGDSPLSHVRE